MRRPAGNLTVPIALIIAAVAASCRPELADPIPEDAGTRYANAVCETYERCGCTGEGLVVHTPESCRDESEAKFWRVADWPDMRFDEECFEQVLDAIEQDDCGPEGPPIPCLVFTGGIPRGAQCIPEWSEDWRDAHPGLLAEGQCNNGACYDGMCGAWEVPLVGVGEACHLELGVQCEQWSYCAPDGICHEEVGLGEPCDTPRACETDYYCDGLTLASQMQGVCAERILEGGACDPEAVEPCEFPGYCSRATQTCLPYWPRICFAALTPATDFYLARDWTPETPPP